MLKCNSYNNIGPWPGYSLQLLAIIIIVVTTLTHKPKLQFSLYVWLEGILVLTLGSDVVAWGNFSFLEPGTSSICPWVHVPSAASGLKYWEVIDSSKPGEGEPTWAACVFLRMLCSSNEALLRGVLSICFVPLCLNDAHFRLFSFKLGVGLSELEDAQ